MLRYRITTPNGNSSTCDMNEAAALAMAARPGWTVQLLGRSLVIIVPDDAPGDVATV